MTNTNSYTSYNLYFIHIMLQFLNFFFLCTLTIAFFLYISSLSSFLSLGLVKYFQPIPNLTYCAFVPSRFFSSYRGDKTWMGSQDTHDPIPHYPLPSLFRSWNRIRGDDVLSLPIRIALYASVEGYL